MTMNPILEQLENEEDVRDAKRILADIKSGKQKVYSQKEFEALTGIKVKR